VIYKVILAYPEMPIETFVLHDQGQEKDVPGATEGRKKGHIDCPGVLGGQAS
jgi:hypothetical protein